MKYWSWKPESGVNFGDDITGYLLDKLVPGKHEWVEPEEAEIIGAGSILDVYQGRFKEGTIVWGSGGGHNPENVKGLRVLAVRGKLTRDRCDLPKDTPLGDPALLLPLIIQPSNKKHRLGLVRHINDKREYNIGHDIEISSNQSVEEVVRQITECETIFSTGLHGMIVAHAYGIPTVPCPPDDGNKFMDFISSLDRPLSDIQDGLLKALGEIG